MSAELQSFNELKSNITIFLQPLYELKVTDRDSVKQATDAFKIIRDYKKSIKKKLDELNDPYKRVVERNRDFAKEIEEPLNKIESFLTPQIVAFERILEAERQEKLRLEREEYLRKQKEAEETQRKILAEAEASAKKARDEAEVTAMFEGKSEEEAKADADKAAALQKSMAEAEAQRIAFETKREHWDSKKEILQDKVQGTRRSWKGEVIDESLIPREYMSVDQVKKNAAIRAGAREIPGVRIFEDLTITARR